MRGRLQPLWVMVSVAGGLCWTGDVSGQAAEEAPSAEYAQHVEAGLAAYGEQRFEDALLAFQAAHALWPNARTHRGLGVAALQLGRLSLAREHLILALTDRRRPLSAGLVDSTREALHMAEAGLAQLTVELDPGAELWIDGARAAMDDDGSVRLDPGVHRLQARRGDTVLRSEEVTFSRGQQRLLPWAGPSDITATAATAAPTREARTEAVVEPAVRTSTNADDERRHVPEGPSPLGPIVVAAAGGAAWVAAIVTGALAQREADALTSACPSRQGCDPALQARAERGATLRDATNALLVGGGVSVLAAGVWWWLMPAHEPAAEARALRFDIDVAQGGWLATLGWTP